MWSTRSKLHESAGWPFAHCFARDVYSEASSVLGKRTSAFELEKLGSLIEYGCHFGVGCSFLSDASGPRQS